MEEISVTANASLQPTHSFVYKGKKFPFNMKLFKCFSQYFKINKQQFTNTTEIDIFNDQNEKINLTESSINDFINFCQSREITLNKDNSPSLLMLAKKYQVSSLIKLTTQFIFEHQKEILIDFYILNQDEEDFDKAQYEEIISKDFLNYINDDKLLLLPIPVLHRIMTKYYQKNSEQTVIETNQSEITEFLFKCLDTFGREASVLFEHIDLSRSNDSIRRLLQYGDKFDFHFINSQHLKSIYQLESEIIEKLAKMTNENKEKDDQIKQKQDEIEKMIRQQEERNKEKDDQIKQKQDEIERLIQQQNDQVGQKQSEMEAALLQKDEKIGQIQSEFESKLRVLNDQVRQLTERLEQQSILVEQLKGKIEEVEKNPPSLKCRFQSESDPKGVIFALGDSVSLSAPSDNDPSFPLSNIKKYDDYSLFINYNHSTPESESKSYIQFDFGVSKKIDLLSYLIRSNDRGPSSSYHPKSWRVEGSNDGSSWARLDRRTNDEHLNGSFKQFHFECQEVRHGSDGRYRYIRYTQEDSWTSSKYLIYISYFELYGDVYYC